MIPLESDQEPHRAICAWCEAEGLPSLLREGREPATHGICQAHSDAMLAEARELVQTGEYPAQPPAPRRRGLTNITTEQS